MRGVFGGSAAKSRVGRIVVESANHGKQFARGPRGREPLRCVSGRSRNRVELLMSVSSAGGGEKRPLAAGTAASDVRRPCAQRFGWAGRSGSNRSSGRAIDVIRSPNLSPTLTASPTAMR